MTQNYTTVVGESAATAARAEIERLTHLLDLSKKTTEAVLERAEKAEAERDFERSSRLTSESQLGVEIDRLIRERDEARTALDSHARAALVSGGRG